MRVLEEEYIINKNGEKTAVILPLQRFERLLEDIHDLAVIAERRDESTVNFDKLKKQLKNDGVL